MIFQSKKIVVAYTAIRCVDCSVDSKRLHADGDYVGMEAKCLRCGRVGSICGIFGEESRA